MPVDPHFWNDNQDWLTATLLNGDLAHFDGKEFTPTGINFHARRPVYKSFAAATNLPGSVGTGVWTEMYQNTGPVSNVSSVVADTGGSFGAWMDPYTTGNIDLKVTGGGGLFNSGGGLIFVSGFSLWPAMSAGNYASGFGDSLTSTDSTDGTFQGGNSAAQGCAFFADIVNGNFPDRYALLGYQNSGSSATPVVTANVDGSGAASRLHAHWASVYPSNGFTVSSIPNPFTGWTPSTQVNATLLNGNQGIRDVLRYLNMPPLVRASYASAGTSLTGGKANFISPASSTWETYGAWSAPSATYTVPQTGLYLVHGVATCLNFSGELRVGVSINNTTYWGPRAQMPGSPADGSGAKTQIFALQAGDIIQLVVWPSANATLSTARPARLVVMQVANIGPPSIAVTAPDTSYRWSAGTQGPLDSLFNQHIANDLMFLSRRPYLLTYQSTPQSGIPMNAATPVSMDTVGGIIHGETGTNADNYSGWNSGTGIYTAQQPGWYMAVWEVFLNNPSLTTNPTVAAAISPTPNGLTGWDTYQRQNMALTGQYPGAAGISYYYLRTGDTIKPGVVTGNSSSTTISTAVNSPGINSHFELVWLGE